jgi:hypothetical protein
MPYSKPHKDD